MTSVLLLDESETERNTFIGIRDESGGMARGYGGALVHLDLLYRNHQANEQHGLKVKLEQEMAQREAHQSGLATTEVVMAA